MDMCEEEKCAPTAVYTQVFNPWQITTWTMLSQHLFFVMINYTPQDLLSYTLPCRTYSMEKDKSILEDPDQPGRCSKHTEKR